MERGVPPSPEKSRRGRHPSQGRAAVDVEGPLEGGTRQRWTYSFDAKPVDRFPSYVLNCRIRGDLPALFGHATVCILNRHFFSNCSKGR